MEKMSDNQKLRIKLIVTIILLILAIIMMGVGIWAAQAGKNRFKGYVNVTTKDIRAMVYAKVTGTRNTEGEGYAFEKLLWDSVSLENNETSAEWKDIDFTFADKDAIIELVIKVDNYNTGSGINTIFNVKLGDSDLDGTERVVGETNISAYIVSHVSVGSAIDESTPTSSEFVVVMKIADKNKSVDATTLDVTLMLSNPTMDEVE